MKDWETIKKIIFKRDNDTCQSCGKKGYLQVHHIIPQSKGGKDISTNLISLCAKCHMLVSPVPDSIIAKLWRIKPKDIQLRRNEVIHKIEQCKINLRQNYL